MDSFTQIVLGAAVGEAVAGKKIGNKALVYGAIAGTIPDLDVFIGNAMGTVEALEFHRGFTHSIAFAVIFSPLIGFLMKKIYSRSSATWRDWTWLFFLGFFTHALLDCFTTWGTQLFWPLDYRVAFKSIFVIDPLYTLPLFFCLVWLAFLPKDRVLRHELNLIGLVVSSVYLLWSVGIKQHINSVFEESFDRQELAIIRYDTRPGPMTTFLWATNAEAENGYYIGYYSLFDDDRKIDYFYFPKNHDLLKPFESNARLQRLIELTDGWFTLQQHETKGIIFNDLRFGQRSGWLDEKEAFVFSYHIYRENDRVVISEMEKEFADGKALVNALWKRIKGN